MNNPYRRVTADEWEDRLGKIDPAFLDECRFLREISGGTKYLETPREYSCRGDSLLLRLKYDPSPAALRLWSFIFSEKNRLFLAKENGWKIFAAMKDLGQTPVIAYALPKTLTFYADELWWAPCFAEDPKLLDVAESLGATDDLCYVRAALGAMITLDYFPKPDLCIAGVGSCCDDFSAVMQLIEWQGHKVHWWEIPARFTPTSRTTQAFANTPFGKSPYQKSAVSFLSEEYKGIVRALEEAAGMEITADMLKGSIRKFNRIRGIVRELRELVYTAPRVPICGLEMLLAEFTAIHACSDTDESIRVLEGILSEAKHRVSKNISPLGGDPVRIFWVTPPTDASIVTLLEDSGGCVTGTEYLISHSYLPLREDIDPLTAIAENYMDDPMIGESQFRAKRIAMEARKFRAEGVLITGIFGASHCPFEERIIAETIEKELDIPVTAFDVPYSPGRISEQVANRVHAFIDVIKSRR